MLLFLHLWQTHFFRVIERKTIKRECSLLYFTLIFTQNMVIVQTRKRKIILANLNKRYLDTPSVHFHKVRSNPFIDLFRRDCIQTSPSLEDSYVTIQSSSYNSFSSDSQEMRSNHRYIKHSKSNRNDDHVTSLKRRIRRVCFRSIILN